MRRLRTILQYRYTFKYLTLVVILVSFSFIFLFPKSSKYLGTEDYIIGYIKQIDIDGNKLTLLIKGKEDVIVNYYFKTLNEKNEYNNNLSLGDKLKIVGELEIPSTNTIFNGFDYKNYLKNKGIFYVLSATKIEKICNNENVFYLIKNKIIYRLDNIDKTGYLKLFFLGDKGSVDNEIIEIYQSNGISHLFAISGMHISVLIGILFMLLKNITYNKRVKYLYACIFLMFYLFLTNYSPSILRASIMFILNAINECYNFKIKKIDIVLFTLDIILIINPYIVFQISFQYSYIISLFIVIFNRKIASVSNKFLRSLYISYLCFMITLPISIYYFNEVNFISIIINIIYIPFVSIIVFPLCIMYFLFSFLEPFFSFCIYLLESSNLFINNIDMFKFVFIKPSFLLIFFYYILIIMMIFNRKYIYLFLVVLALHKNIIYFDNSLKVTVIDVGQGDSIFVKLPNNSSNVLIDTGGIISYNNLEWQKKNKEYSISKDKIIPYLKSVGINKLDVLILTHGDYDHMGDAVNLIDSFKVDKVIFNCGDFNDLEQELIKVLDKKKIKYYFCIKELNIDKYKLQFLNTGIYDDENTSSSVIYLNYAMYKFLFMGDAGKEREDDILEKYMLKDIDFLKVGHHGSNTSSSEGFISSIAPKYSFISVGKNNIYGHPNESVLDVLEKNNSKIYRTDEDGSIEIKINKNGYEIRTCSP